VAGQEVPTLRIIVDTNVLMAAILRRGVVRSLILDHPGAYCTPAAAIVEIWEHREEWNRRGVDDRTLARQIVLLTNHSVTVVDSQHYGRWLRPALRWSVDTDDAPILALALAKKNDGLWTFDQRAFDKERLPRRITLLNTADVARLFVDATHRGSD